MPKILDKLGKKPLEVGPRLPDMLDERANPDPYNEARQ
jgi:hypothetical protein